MTTTDIPNSVEIIINDMKLPHEGRPYRERVSSPGLPNRRSWLSCSSVVNKLERDKED